MIVLERRVAWLFRAVLRRCFESRSAQADRTPLQIRLSPEGLLMRAAAPEIGIIYRQSSPAGDQMLSFAAGQLAKIEGRTREPVSIEPSRSKHIVARWTERGQQREIQIPLLEAEETSLPLPPRRLATLPRSFLATYDAASESAAHSSTKYVINRVQLLGKKGAVAGTDTRQMLVAGSYTFPFKDDVLVPRTSVFSLPLFDEFDSVCVGKTDTHLWIQAGPWQFAMLIDKQGRFPDVMSIVPNPSRNDTRFKLDTSDTEQFLTLLAGRIKRASCRETPLTLDLRDPPSLRFEVDGAVTEVKLPHSQVSGPHVCLCLNLHMFLRAVELRFQEFIIRGADKPVLARDSERIYLVMPLPPDLALPVTATSSPLTTESEPTTPVVPTTTALAEQSAAPIIVIPTTEAPTFGDGDVFTEAEGLREGLVKVAVHAGRILQFLREVCGQQGLTRLIRTSLLALPEPKGEKK